ncbi:MAG: purine-nucleoside phosphorylase [bacterium]|nr:purine-nucleoside phosphorylase [bacterium]
MNERLALLSDRWQDRVSTAVDWLEDRGFRGKAGLILGSGLGNFVDSVDDAQFVDYGSIPGYSATSVAEHTGRLVCGTASGVPVVVMQGRLHPYEGLPAEELLLPTAVLACLGIETALVTNAAGGLNRYYTPGDLMVIRDQLDFHFSDPLRGLLAEPFAPIPDYGADLLPSKADLAALAKIGRSGGAIHLFEPKLAKLLVEAAAETGVPMHSGTYVSMYGPPYEAKAEIGMLRRIGGDAVGMSTAPETILLKRLGVEPVGLSCITNPARETGQPELSHQDVVEVGIMVRKRMARLLLAYLPKIDK